MHIAKEDVPMKIGIPGATARQKLISVTPRALVISAVNISRCPREWIFHRR